MKMKRLVSRANTLGLVGNTFLFVLKLIFGILSGSIALISDAANSLTDIVNSIAIFIVTKVSAKRADKSHPYGHCRAEPVGALIVAISMSILGFEIIKSAFTRFTLGRIFVFSLIPVLVLLVCIAIKLVMWLYLKKVARKVNSPALLANALDSRNDIIISIVALGGIAVSKSYPVFDSVAALAIGLWIIKVGYGIGKENIDYLMGRSPDINLVNEIKARALKIKGVKDAHDIKAHYVGAFVHTEVHIEIDRNMKTVSSHRIGEMVEKAIEEMPSVSKAFIHIDPC